MYYGDMNTVMCYDGTSDDYFLSNTRYVDILSYPYKNMTVNK